MAVVSHTPNGIGSSEREEVRVEFRFGLEAQVIGVTMLRCKQDSHMLTPTTPTLPTQPPWCCTGEWEEKEAGVLFLTGMSLACR